MNLTTILTLLLGFPALEIISFVVVAFNMRRLLQRPAGWLRTALVTCAGLAITYGALHKLVKTGYDANDIFSHPEIGLLYLLGFGWMVAAETTILLIWETLIPTRPLMQIPLLIGSIPSKLRNFKRTMQVISIALKHGLLPYMTDPGRSTSIDHVKLARYTREALQEAGLIFIKLAQFLAGRPDLIRPEYVHEFSKLQADVRPESWDTVRELLSHEWGANIETKVKYLDSEPLAAASIAQVHTGRLHTGEEVAIKIQRRAVAKQLRIDGDIIQRVASWLDRKTQWAHNMGIIPLTEGFVATLHDELDQSLELNNLQTIRASLADLNPKYIILPGDVPNLSTRKVLALQKISGIPLSRAAPLLQELSDTARAEMAIELVDVTLHQIFHSGIFHADLHAGNIILLPNSTLALLDFGMVGRLDRPTRENLLLLLIAIERQDSYVATRALINLFSTNSADIDERELQNQIGTLIMKYVTGFNVYDGRSVLFDLMRVVIDFGFTIPSNISYAFRCMATLDGTIATLAPKLDATQIIKSRSLKLLHTSLSFRELRDTALLQLAVSFPTLQRLPGKIDRVTTDLEQGRLRFRLSLLDKNEDKLYITNQIQHISIILAGIAAFIGGIILVKDAGGPMLTNNISLYTALGYTCMLIGFILNARAITLTAHSEQKYNQRK